MSGVDKEFSMTKAATKKPTVVRAATSAERRKSLGALPDMSVAEFVDKQVDLNGKSQNQIAADAGFKQHQMIYMIKKGKTPIPMDTITALGKALGVDPIYFLRFVLNEYNPSMLSSIEAALVQPMLTANELAIVMAIREINSDDPGLTTKSDAAQNAQLKKLEAFVNALG